MTSAKHPRSSGPVARGGASCEDPCCPAGFHPIVRRWFEQTLGAPTACQVQAWRSISAGRSTLVASPTGSGKTLAAFLVCIDRLYRESQESTLPDAVDVVYVSPLKALAADIRENLVGPLQEIRAEAMAQGLPAPELRVQTRSGDTSASERRALVTRPPHILVTTPESLYLLLTAERSRQVLRRVRTVIVDEIHAVARDKRGAHLALSLERLEVFQSLSLGGDVGLDLLCTGGDLVRA